MLWVCSLAWGGRGTKERRAIEQSDMYIRHEGWEELETLACRIRFWKMRLAAAALGDEDLKTRQRAVKRPVCKKERAKERQCSSLSLNK